MVDERNHFTRSCIEPHDALHTLINIGPR
jgi:hypothetical protein